MYRGMYLSCWLDSVTGFHFPELYCGFLLVAVWCRLVNYVIDYKF